MQPSSIGKYKLEKVIGRGAMGVIHEAFDSVLRRRVAIKTMTGDIGGEQELRDRFHREARAAGNLRHPNIIVIYDMGEEDGTPFIVMELLSGTDLRTMMVEEPRWPEPRILTTAIQAAKGLHYAHQQGVVHRDIKPANIFICNDGVVKILDFGVAHVLSSTLTQSGKLLGSLGYMAPEQIMGHKVDGRADQYSLGVILYEMLTGVKPFVEKDITSTIQAILHRPPLPLSEVRPDCQPPLAEAVMRCLQKNKDDRFPNLAALSRTLTNLYDRLGQPSEAPEPVEPAASETDRPTAPPSQPKGNRAGDTRPWLALPALLNQSRRRAEAGDLPGAMQLLRDHQRLYQGDPEYQIYLQELRREKEGYDKRTLFQKHYQDALRLIEEENYPTARLELQAMLLLDAASPLISQLDQIITRHETRHRLAEWSEQGATLAASGDWPALEHHLATGRAEFGANAEYHQLAQQLELRREKAEVEAILESVRPLQTAGDYDAAADALRPCLRRFPRNRDLVEAYNHLMSDRLAAEQERAQKQFVEEQVKIAGILTRSGQLAQARQYLQVLLEKYPGNNAFEELMIEVENLGERHTARDEIRQAIAQEAFDDAARLLDVYRAAYPGDPEGEILAHEVANLRLTVEHRGLSETIGARLRNARDLADKGSPEQALTMIRELMQQNPDQTTIYTAFLQLRGEVEARRRQVLLEGMAEAASLESRGELFRALEKVRVLAVDYPDEEGLIEHMAALQDRFVLAQTQHARKLLAAGALAEAGALIESSRQLLPDEPAFAELGQALGTEREKNTFISAEIRRAKQAIRANRVDEALEILHALIPLQPANRDLGELIRDLIQRRTRAL